MEKEKKNVELEEALKKIDELKGRIEELNFQIQIMGMQIDKEREIFSSMVVNRVALEAEKTIENEILASQSK